MLETFEKETQPLTEYEQDKLLPIMVRCLSRHVGEEKAITNKQMCEALRDSGYEIGEARIRKLINHIRVNSLIDCLIATSKGYFVADNKSDVISHINSLRGREDAIMAVRIALEEQLARMNEQEELS